MIDLFLCGVTNEMSRAFRPPLCTYRLNWARRTSWGWWDAWDDTVLQTHDSKFGPSRSEADHATSPSRRLPTILTSTRGDREPNPDSGVKGSGANHYPRAPPLWCNRWWPFYYNDTYSLRAAANVVFCQHMNSEYCLTSLSAQSLEYGDITNPVFDTLSYPCLINSRVLYSARSHIHYCTLQAFEQFKPLCIHNIDDKHPTRPGCEPSRPTLFFGPQYRAEGAIRPSNVRMSSQ